MENCIEIRPLNISYHTYQFNSSILLTMKKFYLCLLALSAIVSAYADGSSATITSVPSPAVTTKALEVTIKTDNFGSEVYCYTWCADINGSEKTPSWDWNGVHTDKFKMSGQNGTYTIKINKIKDFYELSDSELSGLKKLGFIAKTKDGKQTADVFIEVVQGRENVYSGGEGTAANPFIIKTANDLKELSATPMDWASDVYIKLGADIDAQTLTASIGSKSQAFKGSFDGAGHTISNIRLTNANVGEAIGLFGAIDGATIKDLGVANATISGTTYAGILVGYATNGKIERCFTSGSVSGSSICVGGLVGENAGGNITDCYSGAKVANDDDYATGGLAGKNTGTIANTYAAGHVSGKDYVGGVVGANYGTVKSSVALNGKITSSNDFVARFGGNNNSRNITAGNYSWNLIPAGHSTWANHGDHASQQTASYLNDFETFKSITGWDFDNVWEWRTESNKQYPVLRDLSNQDCVIPKEFFEATTGVDNITADETYIAVGPNPTDGMLYINSSSELAECGLYSVNGALASVTDAASQSSVAMDLSYLPAGIYILHVTTAQGSMTIHKIIKK